MLPSRAFGFEKKKKIASIKFLISITFVKKKDYSNNNF